MAQTWLSNVVSNQGLTAKKFFQTKSSWDADLIPLRTLQLLSGDVRTVSDATGVLAINDAGDWKVENRGNYHRELQMVIGVLRMLAMGPGRVKTWPSE